MLPFIHFIQGEVGVPTVKDAAYGQMEVYVTNKSFSLVYTAWFLAR